MQLLGHRDEVPQPVQVHIHAERHENKSWTSPLFGLNLSGVNTLFVRTALALAVVTGAVSCSGDAPAPGEVGRFASPNPGSVNVFWFDTPAGLVVVDAGRNVSGGERVVSELRSTGRPVLAVLITHPHPDHVGGLGVLRAAFGPVPVYASEATAAWMRADPLGFYSLARRDDPGFPAELHYPDRTFAPGSTLDLGGVRVETAQFEAGESETATAYYLPAAGALFSGDLTGNDVTPALLEGHTCGWLTNLDRLRARFPEARTIYPGHGDPAPAADQIDEQRDYLRQFRALVWPAVDAGSPGGARVSEGELAGIVAELERRYPGYPRVASLPNLQEVNIAAVAGELSTQDSEALPAVCRG